MTHWWLLLVWCTVANLRYKTQWSEAQTTQKHILSNIKVSGFEHYQLNHCHNHYNLWLSKFHGLFIILRLLANWTITIHTNQSRRSSGKLYICDYLVMCVKCGRGWGSDLQKRKVELMLPMTSGENFPLPQKGESNLYAALLVALRHVFTPYYFKRRSSLHL